MDSKETLIADLIAARTELLVIADMVPAEDRSSRKTCGEWTLKDVLGHVADWERVWVDSLRYVAAGRQPDFGHLEGIEARNQGYYETRCDQPWEEIWSDLITAHEDMLQVLQGLGEEDLERSMIYLLGAKGPVHRWVRIFIAHDLEHARDLKHALA